MVRFYISLYSAKIYLFFARILKKDRSDKVAFLVDRICPDFLNKVKKPKLVIAVTGTNGKTSTTSLVTQSLKNNGLKVAYNDWGANLYAGHIRCFLDTINIFNKTTKDAIVLESDELTIGNTLKRVEPNYIIITNICRDSIRRNAYPEYIKETIDKAINYVPNATLILNADDPISSFIGQNNKRIYISVDKYLNNAYLNSANDFTCCPKCNGKIKYIYRHYRHIGKFKCLNCGLESFDSNYKVTSINEKNNTITIDNFEYPLISKSIFNVYNETLVLGLLKELKIDNNKIKNIMSNIKIPSSREDLIEVKDYRIHLQMAKGQNGSAASSVFESLAKDKTKKQLILIFDEDYVSHIQLDAEETITWFYDADYEFLNSNNIKKIIIPSKLKDDYILRLKMAEISDDKFVCLSDYNESYKEVDLNLTKDIYILYEVDDRPQGLKVANLLKSRIEGEIK